MEYNLQDFFFYNLNDYSFILFWIVLFIFIVLYNNNIFFFFEKYFNQDNNYLVILFNFIGYFKTLF